MSKQSFTDAEHQENRVIRRVMYAGHTDVVRAAYRLVARKLAQGEALSEEERAISSGIICNAPDAFSPEMLANYKGEV